MTKRLNRGYNFAAPTVPNDDWIGQVDAANMLGVGIYHLSLLISAGRLTPVHNARGQAGVTKDSVEHTHAVRQRANLVERAWMFVVDVVKASAHHI